MSGYRTEVAIVGGGIIGCSVAYHLSRKGLKATVIERHEVGGEASGANSGLVRHVTREPGIHLELSRRGSERFARFEEEMGYDVEYRMVGTLLACLTDEEVRRAEGLVARQQQVGLDVRMLSLAEARELEPMLPDSVLAAAYCPLDCILNPFKATAGYADAARRLGAEFWLGVEAQSIIMHGGRVEGLETTRGRVHADVVVLAAGSWSPDLARSIGLDLPVIPSRGQILVTEPVRRILPGPFVAGFEPTPRQTGSGNIMIGSAPEFVGFDKRAEYRTIREFARTIVDCFPALKDLHVIRSWGGLRPATPDDLPLLGAVDGCAGLILATGHNRHGLGSAPATGEMIARLIVSGEMDPIVAECGLGRFLAVKPQLHHQ